MLIVLFSFLLIIISLHGIQVDFERFEQLSGFHLYNSSLRVRKYNRTVVTLNGTLEIVASLDQSIMISTDIFHSPLGNQQFNHYPMKLPSKPLCDFLDMLYAEYSNCLANIHNLPERGTCPILPLEVYTIDKVFPTKSVPPFLPKGLWKVFIIFTLNDKEVLRLMWMIKASNDLV
uniref:MD-2-related lipid-recognition domain-containing protein n=1 Tax=Anopheles epiroticus TaxID=199890 RepID=A0A182PWJ8_9DIPT